MKKLPSFHKPLKKFSSLDFTPKYWEEAKKSFENKDYFASVISLLQYLNYDFFKRKKCKDSCNFSAIHNNIKIDVKIDKKYFYARVNFLQVDEKTNKIALFRRISELNFKDLSYVRYVLKDNLIFIEAKEPLELLHPYKLYEIMRDMIYASSYYKEHFIKEFNAKDINQVQKEYLNNKEFNKVKEQINLIIQETKKSLNTLVKEDLQKYEWDFLAIALMQLSIMPYLQGNIRYKLSLALNTLFSSSNEYDKRIQKGIEFLEELENLSKDELKSSLYYPKLFLPPKRYFNETILKELLEEESESINKYLKKEDFQGLAFYLYGFFLDLIDRYNVKNDLQEKIFSTLDSINNKELKDTGKKLYSFYEKLLDNEQERDFSFIYILLLVAILYLLSRL